MSTSIGNNLNRKFASRVIFYTLTNILLVAFAWMAGWWLKGRSFEAYAQYDYFSNTFRSLFVVYIIVEAIIDFAVSPRWIRPMDEVPHEWLHWRARMWETVLVVAVFSDCMGILPISSDQSIRFFGIFLLVLGLIPYIYASIHRQQFLANITDLPFPTRGIFGIFRSPESLSAIITELGTALIFNAWAGIFCVLIAIGIHIGYVKDQDRMMLEKYGNTWSEYYKKTIFKL